MGLAIAAAVCDTECMRNQHGFTLVELLITMALVAIVLAIAVPSFQTLVANNKATTATNRILTAVNLARSEAVKRGVEVEVCGADSSMNGCAGSATDGGNGYLVRPTATGATPIRVFEKESLGDRYTVSSGGNIVFSGLGGLTEVSDTQVGVKIECDGGTTVSGQVDISPAGQATANAPAC